MNFLGFCSKPTKLMASLWLSGAQYCTYNCVSFCVLYIQWIRLFQPIKWSFYITSLSPLKYMHKHKHILIFINLVLIFSVTIHFNLWQWLSLLKKKSGNLLLPTNFRPKKTTCETRHLPSSLPGAILEAEFKPLTSGRKLNL